MERGVRCMERGIREEIGAKSEANALAKAGEMGVVVVEADEDEVTVEVITVVNVHRCILCV